MSDVMVLKQVVLKALAMAHEAIGDELGKPGYGYDDYIGLFSATFLARYFGILPGALHNYDDGEYGEDLFLSTVQYKQETVHIPHPSNLPRTSELVISWIQNEGKGKRLYFFPLSFSYGGKDYTLKDFLDGTLLPWDQQGEVCTQSAHSTNPLATMENALKQADFKRKEEVMRKFNSFSSALMKSDFVPPWDRSVKR